LLKEFRPAVEWLERNYDIRDRTSNGWRHKLDPLEDAIPEGMDLNCYRRGPFQLLGEPSCGDSLRAICEESRGEGVCTHPEHDRLVDCFCFRGTPAMIQGLTWTSSDERSWLRYGNYRGDITQYIRNNHPYVYDKGHEDTPNNIIWWEEEKVDASTV